MLGSGGAEVNVRGNEGMRAGTFGTERTRDVGRGKEQPPRGDRRAPGAREGIGFAVQKESPLRTSPPAIVPRARQTKPSTEFLKYRTLPSASRELTPPLW